jgi:hypothetical protein
MPPSDSPTVDCVRPSAIGDAVAPLTPDDFTKTELQALERLAYSDDPLLPNAIAAKLLGYGLVDKTRGSLRTNQAGIELLLRRRLVRYEQQRRAG